VGGVVVAHAIGRTRRVEVFAQHQTAGLLESQLPRDAQRDKLKGREKNVGSGDIDPVTQFSDRIAFEKDGVF
jgi:hypothetical protein